VNEFLRLTHLHVDGHKTAEALSDYIQQGQIPDRGFIDADIAENPKGFYSLETLLISSRACTCPDLQSVFYKSCVPEGDNDSTTALSFALKVIHTIKSNESDIPNLGLDRLISRLTKSDREEIESSLK
jgi:hypothetical protein